jgi:hypothetical protein
MRTFHVARSSALSRKVSMALKAYAALAAAAARVEDRSRS